MWEHDPWWRNFHEFLSQCWVTLWWSCPEMKLLKGIHSLLTWPHTNSAVKPEVRKSFFCLFSIQIFANSLIYLKKIKNTKAQFQLQNIFDFKLLLFLFVLQKSSEEMWKIVSYKQLVWQYDYEHDTIHEKKKKLWRKFSCVVGRCYCRTSESGGVGVARVSSK